MHPSCDNVTFAHTMAKRIVILLLIVVVVAAAGSYAYSRYRTDRRFNGGEVVPGDSGKVVSEDGSAPVLTPTRSETTETQPSRPTAQPRPVPTTAAPLTDSIAPNPPNHAAFAGTGKFQVYRQGDLTWRLNTDDGQTCILFATMDQWRKPLVYRNACPTS